MKIRQRQIYFRLLTNVPDKRLFFDEKKITVISRGSW